MTQPQTTVPLTQRLQVKPDEAAQLLSISKMTLFRLTERGELRSIGSGRLRRYAVADLVAYMERQRSDN
jgi:excisionase family DNA binding protein